MRFSFSRSGTETSSSWRRCLTWWAEKSCTISEKDIWKIFCIIVRERKRREIRPAINVLRDCHERTESPKGAEAAAFSKQVKALHEFLEMTDGLLSKIARSEKSVILPWALKWLA